MTKLIPFSRKLYEKGYRVVRRDGLKVIALHFSNYQCGDSCRYILQIFEPKNSHLVSVYNYPNGLIYEDENLESGSDLLLETKTIDLWIGIIKKPNSNIDNMYTTSAATTDKNKLSCSDHVVKIVKVTVYEDTLEQIK